MNITQVGIDLAKLVFQVHGVDARGVHHNKVTAAIARELCGFIWDIGGQIE